MPRTIRKRTSRRLRRKYAVPSLDGRIMDVAIWNRHLSQTEQVDIYNSGLAIPMWKWVVYKLAISLEDLAGWLRRISRTRH